MCGIIGYVGPRECRDLLLEGLRRLEYRGYDSAGVSLLADDAVGSVHAVGNLQHLRDAVAERERAPARLDRHRPHALGHPRPRDRGQRPPALRHLGPRAHRAQRDRRELDRPARAPRGGRRRVHLRDRRRGRGAPDRPAPRRRPHGGRPPGLQRAARPLRVRRDVGRRPGRARGRPQGVPAGGRPRRRRELHRLRDPGLPRRDPPRPARQGRRDRRDQPPRARASSSRSAAARSSARSRRSTGTTRPPRRAATRPSCSRRSTSRPTRSPRRWPTACTPTGIELGDIGISDDVPAQRAPHRDRRLRHLLPRRPRRPLLDRDVVARARSRWTSRPSSATATR